jgi:isopentenyldiphosphate isomerase
MEQFDLVDVNDTVIGITDKPTAHAEKQLHRVAAVYVFNEGGELYVQVHKSSGSLYDHSVGGHVSKGEDYATAAGREANEELGITQPLTHLANFYSDEGIFLHMFGLFECVAAPTWKFVPNEEVEEIIPMKMAEIRHLMKTNPEKFTGGFINSMREYCKIKNLQ